MQYSYTDSIEPLLLYISNYRCIDMKNKLSNYRYWSAENVGYANYWEKETVGAKTILIVASYLRLQSSVKNILLVRRWGGGRGGTGEGGFDGLPGEVDHFSPHWKDQLFPQFFFMVDENIS